MTGAQEAHVDDICEKISTLLDERTDLLVDEAVFRVAMHLREEASRIEEATEDT